MMVEAPGLFSTIADAPRAGPSFDATCRAWMSLVPPGGKGTTIRTGLPGFGKPWASALDSCRHAHAAKADVIRRDEKIMTSYAGPVEATMCRATLARTMLDDRSSPGPSPRNRNSA